MLSDKTKLQIIFINQSLEKKSLLITTHVCVPKEYMLLVPKIPVRSGCCSSFRPCLYVLIQKQQISLTQYTSSLVIALISQLLTLSSLFLTFFVDLWLLYIERKYREHVLYYWSFQNVFVMVFRHSILKLLSHYLMCFFRFYLTRV